MHVAIEVILHLLRGDVERLGEFVRAVQRPPVGIGHFAIRAVVMEHLESAVGEDPLRKEGRVGAHAGFAGAAGHHAMQIADPHLLPERGGLGENRRFALCHGQRAVGKSLGLFNLNESDGFAQRFEDLQTHCRLAGKPVEFGELGQQLALGFTDVCERNMLEPRLAGQHIAELGRRLRGDLGQFEIGVRHLIVVS